MTPPSPRAASAGSSTAASKYYKSPPAKKHDEADDTPPIPPPPPPPAFVPGPNAFAQPRRGTEDPRRFMDSIEESPEASKYNQQQYTVHTYRNLDPTSPTVNRYKSRAKPHHRRNESSTDQSQSGIASASSESAPWSGNASSFDSPTPYSNPEAAQSRFFRQMRQARERLDESRDAVNSPVEPGSARERLKLVPSPDPNVTVQPTYRAIIEAKTEERLRQLINNDGTVSSNTQIATIHNTTPQSLTIAKADPASELSTSKVTKNTKRNIFNKIGLGLKMTSGEQGRRTPPPMLTISNVPPKAAKVLGARSLPTRDRHAEQPPSSEMTIDSSSTVSPLEESIRRSHSEPSPKRGSHSNTMEHAHQRGGDTTAVLDPPEQRTPPKSPLRRQSRRLPVQTRVKQYDDDNPPTPPSKPRPQQQIGKQEQSLEESSPVPDKQINKRLPRRSRSLEASSSPSSAQTRNGFAGHHSAAAIEASPAISSMYGNVMSSLGASPNSIRHSFPERSPASKARQHSGLPPTRYDPTSPRAVWSFSHLPERSPNSLKPVPLRVATHKKNASSSQAGQQSSSNGSSGKSRDVSESTSASVPVFLDTPLLQLSGSTPATATVTGEGSDEGHIGGGEEQTLTIEVLHEYLVETWRQGEVIQQMLEAQAADAKEARKEANDHYIEMKEKVDSVPKRLQGELISIKDNLAASRSSQSEQSKAEAATASPEMQALQRHIEVLTQAVAALQTTVQALTAASNPTKQSSTASTAPTASTSNAPQPEARFPSLTDFAAMPRNEPSPTHAHTYPPYTNLRTAAAVAATESSPTRPKPHHRRNQSRLHLEQQRQPQGPLQRIDTTPLFGSSPMRSRADLAITPNDTGAVAAASRDQARPGQQERTPTSAASESSQIGIGGTGVRSQEMRSYLQSVPQSAQTDPGIRGQTWGRKMAKEKFERWTG